MNPLQGDWETSWTIHPVIPRRLTWIFGALVGFGIATFLLSLKLNPMQGWQAYLINFLFWVGMAQGAVVFAAIYHVVGAKWGATTSRLAEGAVAYLPVGLVSFLPLYVGLKLFFIHVRIANPERGAWFDPRFIFVRGGLGLGLMTVLSLFFVYYHLRPEVGIAQEKKLRPATWFYRWIVDGWQGEDEEVTRCGRGMDFLSAGVLLAYPMTYTFMAFDLIMALDPVWHSSLFGGYFFVSTFYLGLAGLAVVSVLLRWNLGDSFIPDSQLSDLGNLLLGFNLTYLAMVWGQYIVIWYGNLPEETHFIILRVWEKPWAFLSWSVLALSVLIPFLVFLSRRAKQIPWLVLCVGVLISTGLWIERYILIVPSLWSGTHVPFGWIEVGITAGFLGAAGLSYLFFLQNFPLRPYNKAMLGSTMAEHEKVEETASRI
ncbi:MAG: hypothetical protein ACM37Z_07300 [Deltaproteobacteria bacterium]